MPNDRIVIDVVVNGERHSCEVPARLHVADFIRDVLGLTGTHIGCEQGVCGACTVLVNGSAVKSCLMLAAQLGGTEVETVEYLAPGDELAEVQCRFKEEHGLQCGFCTPGFLMTLAGLARTGHFDSSEAEVRSEISGVLCRCTGYSNIVAASRRYLEGAASGGFDE